MIASAFGSLIGTSSFRRCPGTRRFRGDREIQERAVGLGSGSSHQRAHDVVEGASQVVGHFSRDDAPAHQDLSGDASFEDEIPVGVVIAPRGPLGSMRWL